MRSPKKGSELSARQAMVQTRTQCICIICAQLSAHGIQIPNGSAEHCAQRVRALHLPPAPLAPVEPLLRLLDILGSEIDQSEQQLCEPLKHDRTSPCTGHHAEHRSHHRPDPDQHTGRCRPH